MIRMEVPLFRSFRLRTSEYIPSFRMTKDLFIYISIIGNVSSSTGILILNGENDTQTPVQQALLLQQRLTELTHCDQPGWPSCYSVRYTDGQKNPGNSCPTGHSTEFCRGWVDAYRANIR